MTKQILRTENLSLSYEDCVTPVLQDVSLSIMEGDDMLILGPSGSGKSSFTHCLNGLYPRELDGEMSGEVWVHGKRTNDYQPGEISKHIGVVFQDPETQFCMLTVEDEVAFGLENLSMPLNAMRAKVEEVLTWVGLLEYKEKTIAQLSGGQKQKLALACVLAMEPEVLILDEPTANLDPIATREFIGLLRYLKQHLSLTLVVIEHQLEGWVEILDRVFILQMDGSVYYDGPLQEGLLHSAPALQQQGISLPYATKQALSHNWCGDLPLTIADYVASGGDFPVVEEKAAEQTEKWLATRNIGWKKILNGIDLAIHKKEWIAIVGANGSGKTSFSKLLAGITKPSSGKITLHDRTLSKWSEQQLRSEIGYVFQNPEHQFITDSVFEEVAFGLKVEGIHESRLQEVVHSTLQLCRLDGLENQHPFLLSQGQKRRLSVATMIVSDQRMLFLDEPTFGQDATSTVSLMDLLQEKHKQGTTIIMITHDMDLVDRFATRVVVMEKGTIAFDKPPEILWKHQDLEKYSIEKPPRITMTEMIEERKRSYVSS
ncbi:ABC transporter ATP-binding protein [Halobacillus litoralis]|uniref:ABC transporter ATP-binding protein n=1 Tax=Halobacillus litoralis TaxID=45668 RepID=UPI002493C894|nr:ABC transporter ATP-binding protein [Halobacillus litoralis]